MTFSKDLLERVIRTYVAAFAGLLVASGWLATGTVNLSAVQSAALAAIPAAISVLFGVGAKFVGDPNSASVLLGVVPPAPKGDVPPVPPIGHPDANPQTPPAPPAP